MRMYAYMLVKHHCFSKGPTFATTTNAQMVEYANPLVVPTPVNVPTVTVASTAKHVRTPLRCFDYRENNRDSIVQLCVLWISLFYI